MVARGTVRSQERAEELLAGRAAQWVAVGVGRVPPRVLRRDGRHRPAARSTPAPARIQLDAHVLEKALYEIRYELDHRPDWVGIPIHGVATLLAGSLAETRDSEPSER